MDVWVVSVLAWGEGEPVTQRIGEPTHTWIIRLTVSEPLLPVTVML